MLKSSENDDANMTEVSKELQTFTHQSLLLALSEISSPVITLLFFILQILGSIWALFFTIKFLKNDAPKLLRKVKTAAVTWHQQRKIKTVSSVHTDGVSGKPKALAESGMIQVCHTESSRPLPHVLAVIFCV